MEKNNSLIKAINKNIRTSPRKLALVCNFIKGKKADVALRDLDLEPKVELVQLRNHLVE